MYSTILETLLDGLFSTKKFETPFWHFLTKNSQKLSKNACSATFVLGFSKISVLIILCDEIKTKRHAFFAPVKIVKFVGFTPWIVENLLSKWR